MKKLSLIVSLISLLTFSMMLKPATGADWKAEWDQVVAAAQKEGTVIVGGGPGGTYRDAVMPFQKAYPGIRLEFSGIHGREFGPKVLAERKAGRYLWDVHLGGTETALSQLKPNGVLDPLKPVLMLPEVLDGTKWFGGHEDSWVDLDGQYIFQAEGRLTFIFMVNRSVAPESELKLAEQLLEPKWKGRIVAEDPTKGGKTRGDVAHLLLVKGDDWIRKFLAQDLVIMNNGRQRAEALIKGRFAVGMGLSPTFLTPFQKAGVMDHVKELAPDTPAGARQTNGFGNLMLVNRAPHPNAAKVFINWVLSVEGQKAHVKASGVNSRRLDVEGPPDTALKPNVKYYNINMEKYNQNNALAIKIAREVIWKK
ncbi:MAG: extracellular solute-binding protein [Desulfobacterales bacterium]|nr:extracellular solute-binding protein [Desulfobacterales bacterium]